MTSFSIVTIVYNDVTHIKETMESVINQSYKNIEYILVDGGSNDGTKEAIIELISSCATITLEEQKEERFYLEATHNTYPTLTFKFLSERDKGIYDAMNKGIALASREWINFMNCGDRFYRSDVLEQINKIDIDNCDVFYGDFCLVFGKQNIIKRSDSDPYNLYKLFRNFCHQSFFFRTSIHKKHPYSFDYKLASDYELIYHLYSSKHTFKHIPIIICFFSCGGNTDQHALLSLKEGYLIARKFSSSKIQLLKVNCHYIIGFLRKILKKILLGKI